MARWCNGSSPRVRDAVSPQIAYLMNRVLEGVITDGTGRAAKGLGQPYVAGKTGTTDDNNSDAWFRRLYTRDLAVGVWVGFDEPKSLGSQGNRRTRGTTDLAGLHGKAPSRPDRTRPSSPRLRGSTIVTIDRETGLKADRRAGCERPHHGGLPERDRSRPSIARSTITTSGASPTRSSVSS